MNPITPPESQPEDAPISQPTLPEGLEMEDFEPTDLQECESSAAHQPPSDYQTYQPPPGYILVEKSLYEHLLSNLTHPSQPQQIKVELPTPPVQAEKPFFHFRINQQYMMGDIKYNFSPGEEGEYCPGEYLKVGGHKFVDLKCFVKVWKLNFSSPSPARPIFDILNPDTCPPLANSFGKTIPSRFVNDIQRIEHEEIHGDAARHRVRVPGETAEHNLGITMTPQPRPQSAYQQPSVQPPAQIIASGRLGPNDMPPSGGPRGPDGLTERARYIKAMQGDNIERPAGSVSRDQQPGYREPQTVSDFPVNPAVIAGGNHVAMIPGPPADEAAIASRRRG
jgi:hypothetical protein